MRRYRTLIVTIMPALLLLAAQTAGAGTVSAYQISSNGQLLSGSSAEGQTGDIMMENDLIAIVITAIGHTVGYGATGGNIIDAGSSVERIDGFGELYTYFDNDWPRQAEYSGLSILDNGAAGGPAVVRVTGVDSDNSNLTVSTDYILAADESYLTLSTTVTHSGGPTVKSFELGDAFSWGSSVNFAPGYGFTLSGVTYQPWLGGTSFDGISIGYFSADVGTVWGDHGGGWSDINDTTVSISGGESRTYERYFVVGGKDIASVATIVHEINGAAVGSLSSNVSASSTGAPLNGAEIGIYDLSESYYVQMISDAAGDASATLPPGEWRLAVSAAGYETEEAWVTVTTGGSADHDFSLDEDTSIPGKGDTLTVIQRPILNIPAIVMPGDTLPIECEAPPATDAWSAVLLRSTVTLPLSIISSSYDPSTEWWTLSAVIPSVPVYDLFDLAVYADGGIADTSWNAVQVIDEYKDDYYFIHITDSHMPTHSYYYEAGSETDSSEMEDLRAIIDDVGIINPAFVLHTGDLINEGELEDYLSRRYYTRSQRVLAEFDVPLYLVAGNHDIGGWDATPPPDGTARREWWRFFGWKRLNDPPAGAPLYTQNYSFDYGPVHFTGLEAYNNYDSWRTGTYGSDSFTPGQMSWLSSDLAAASGSASQVLFYHMDFTSQIDLNSLGAEMSLYGHIHSNDGSTSSPPYNLATDNTCDGARSFRIVRVNNGVLNPRQTRSSGSNGNNIRVIYSPANNGTATEMTAEVYNSLPERFQHGLLRFNMASGGGTADVTGGTLVQIDETGPFPVYYVNVDIQAGASGQLVAISLDQTVVDVALPEAPGMVRLGQNHPNPFNPVTRIEYALPEASRVQLIIFDTGGREVITLVDGHRGSGPHEVTWNGTDEQGRRVASGMYVARLVAGDDIRTRKIVLAR